MKKVSYDQLAETCGDPIVVVSHPRSGTHLTIDLLRKQFKECVSYKWPGEPQERLYLAIEGFLEKNKFRRLKEMQAYDIVRRSDRPIIKMHTYSWEIISESYPEWMRWIQECGKIIYVYRDVMSVMVSFYNYAQTFDINARVPISEFIKQSFCGRKSRPAYWKEMMDTWSRKVVFSLDFDEIIRNTDVVLNKIGSYLDLNPIRKKPLLPEKINSLYQYRWQRLISIRPESSAILGKNNKASNDWKKILSAEDIAFINSQIEQD